MSMGTAAGGRHPSTGEMEPETLAGSNFFSHFMQEPSWLDGTTYTQKLVLSLGCCPLLVISKNTFTVSLKCALWVTWVFLNAVELTKLILTVESTWLGSPYADMRWRKWGSSYPRTSVHGGIPHPACFFLSTAFHENIYDVGEGSSLPGLLQTNQPCVAPKQTNFSSNFSWPQIVS